VRLGQSALLVERIKGGGTVRNEVVDEDEVLQSLPDMVGIGSSIDGSFSKFLFLDVRDLTLV
jgi:hypothetical protein